MKNIVPYIHEQFPDQDIEFITGNNDTDLYSYFEEHGELPDIITVRRFSGKDAQDLEPYLMDFASYDVVSRSCPFVRDEFFHCVVLLGFILLLWLSARIAYDDNRQAVSACG